MKNIWKRLAALACVLCLLCSVEIPGHAMQSSLSKKTGYKAGQVIKTTYGVTGGARTRHNYIRSKDVYVSEKVVTNKWVKDVTKWSATDSLQSLSYNKSVSVSATGSVDVIKAMGFKASVSVGSSTSAGGVHKADPKKGSFARLAIKSDFIEVTYKHYTYNTSKKQTGCETLKVLIPIPDTQVYYVRYQN